MCIYIRIFVLYQMISRQVLFYDAITTSDKKKSEENNQGG